jgi:hypothetical protein
MPRMCFKAVENQWTWENEHRTDERDYKVPYEAKYKVQGPFNALSAVEIEILLRNEPECRPQE